MAAEKRRWRAPAGVRWGGACGWVGSTAVGPQAHASAASRQLPPSHGRATHVLPQDVRSDPTLPRTNDVRCPACAHDEAVFFSSSTEEGMTLFFSCVRCVAGFEASAGAAAPCPGRWGAGASGQGAARGCWPCVCWWAWLCGVAQAAHLPPHLAAAAATDGATMSDGGKALLTPLPVFSTLPANAQYLLSLNFMPLSTAASYEQQSSVHSSGHYKKRNAGILGAKANWAAGRLPLLSPPLRHALEPSRLRWRFGQCKRGFKGGSQHVLHARAGHNLQRLSHLCWHVRLDS